MKTLQIENTREIFFNDSKEQYLHFKKVWSQAVNSEKAKKTTTEHTYPSHYWQGGQSIDDSKKWTTRENGWLLGSHHLIYALLRGSDALRGFTPATSKNKLSNGGYINNGLYAARKGLRYAAFNMNESQLEEFLAPFEGTVTLEMLKKLDNLCPTVDPLQANYGKGKQIAEKFLAGQITEQDLWECVA